MKLYTEVKVKAEEPKIDYNSSVFLIGSCFVNNIGEKLDYYQFQNLRNPLGNVFHPLAISTFLERCEQGYVFSEKDVFEYQERWLSYQAHSETAQKSKLEMVSSLNETLASSRSYLKSSSHVIITLGTSWVYEKIDSGEVVVNCHKVPQKEFTKRILSVLEIEHSIQKMISSIRSFNEEMSIIFTISPVRHIKDGMVQNNRSKANLISSLQNIVESGLNNVSYFPAYEIVIDELRDYRYYDRDLVHPNSLAVDIIWERFAAEIISENDVKVMKEINSIQNALMHKPFNEDSSQHKYFIKNLENKINHLRMKFPHLKF